MNSFDKWKRGFFGNNNKTYNSTNIIVKLLRLPLSSLANLAD